MKYIYLILLALLLIMPASATYYDTAYPFRVGPIYINQSAINGTHNDFPTQLVITVTGFESYHPVLVINGTRVPCENESYSNNNLTIFYKANLSSVTNPEIYVYASSAAIPAANTYGSHNVWGTSVENVYLMAGDADDSTSNSRNLTETGTITYPDADYGLTAYADWTNVNKMTGVGQAVNPGTGDYQVTTRFRKSSPPTSDYTPSIIGIGTGNQQFAGAINKTTGYVTLITRETSYSSHFSSTGVCDDDWHTITFRRNGTELATIIDGVNSSTNATLRDTGTADDIYVGIRDNPLYDYLNTAYIGLLIFESAAKTNEYEDTRHNNLNNPTATGTAPFYSSIGDKGYYTNSLHYNALLPYLHTIESDGTITSNRSVTPADDTHWTAKSTSTTYWIFDTDVAPSGHTVFILTGSTLDEFNVSSMSTNTNYTIYKASIVGNFTTDGSGYANSPTNLAIGTYIVYPTGLTLTPVLTSITNNISTDIYPKVEKGSAILFIVTRTPDIATTYYWYADEVLQDTNTSSISIAWTSVGTKNVTVWATNGHGTSNTLINYPVIKRAMASSADVHELYSEEGSEMLMESIDTDEPDIQLFFLGSAHPYMIIIGSAFFLFLYGLPMILIWISTKKVLIPTGLTMIFGVIFLGSIPGMFVGPAILFMVITCVGIIYSLAKER